MVREESIKAYALKNAIEHEGKATVGPIINSLFNEGLEKDKIKEIMPQVQKILNEVNSLELEKQTLLFEKYKEMIGHRPQREGLPELDEVSKTGIITRFSPSSSASAFHIGHILTGMPACLYVKKYGGKFYLRIEDTNPEKTVAECYKSFPKEAEWIFGNITEWYAQSDRMDKYYQFAEDLIKKGLAFICICKKEEGEDENLPRRPCGCRNNSIKDNQEKWKNMLDKRGFKQGEAVLRFKSANINLSNPALIDFPLARINETAHPRQGKKYRVWPLMNLCVTYDDIEQKCTHIIRGKEHRDNALRQEMIFDALKIKKPYTYFVGRYKFTDLEISKTKITERIKKGEFTGWDDIRLPLARNFKKRGYLPEAFAGLAIQRGISEVDKVISQKDFFEVLNNFNREILRDKARKVSFAKTSEKESNIEILMPDNTKVYVRSEIKPKKDEIVYFGRFGYARYNGKEDGKPVFWFCHE
jgi:glutamyl-tRNA synthetase